MQNILQEKIAGFPFNSSFLLVWAAREVRHIWWVASSWISVCTCTSYASNMTWKLKQKFMSCNLPVQSCYLFIYSPSASPCRNTDIASRRKYVNLVESVKKYGGTVHIFSSMHVSGDREYTATIHLIHNCSFHTTINEKYWDGIKCHTVGNVAKRIKN